MDSPRTNDRPGPEYDVAVVGGGPAGCSAGLFTARYGLDTVLFDRGRSSLKRCAFLENYLGFPAGIDVETLYDLLHDHVEEAGGTVVPDLVASVDRAGEGFVVETRDGRSVTARWVVAATRYGGEYLRPLVGEEPFETHDHDGESREVFDRTYADRDGTTPVDGLYVASPSAESDRQAIVAAGRGARVGLAVVEAAREEEGFPVPVRDHYDWMRRADAADGWCDGDRWREWFDSHVPDDVPEERRTRLRECEVERHLDACLSGEEIEARTARGQRRLLEHLDDDLVLERARELVAADDTGSTLAGAEREPGAVSPGDPGGG